MACFRMFVKTWTRSLGVLHGKMTGWTKMEIRKTELHEREMLDVWMDIELLLMTVPVSVVKERLFYIKHGLQDCCASECHHTEKVELIVSVLCLPNRSHNQEFQSTYTVKRRFTSANSMWIINYQQISWSANDALFQTTVFSFRDAILR